jgi:hypothetical protein
MVVQIYYQHDMANFMQACVNFTLLVRHIFDITVGLIYIQQCRADFIQARRQVLSDFIPVCTTARIYNKPDWAYFL